MPSCMKWLRYAARLHGEPFTGELGGISQLCKAVSGNPACHEPGVQCRDHEQGSRRAQGTEQGLLMCLVISFAYRKAQC